jgi:hypothetical protein
MASLAWEKWWAEYPGDASWHIKTQSEKGVMKREVHEWNAGDLNYVAAKFSFTRKEKRR